MKKRKQKTYKEQTTHAAQQPKKTKGTFAAPRSLIGRTNAIWTASMRCGGLHRFAWGIWAWQGTNYRLTIDYDWVMYQKNTQKSMRSMGASKLQLKTCWADLSSVTLGQPQIGTKKIQNGMGSHLHATIRTPPVERLVVLLHRPRRALPSQWSGLWYSSPDEHVPTDSGMFGVETKMCSKSTSKASHQRLCSNAMCSLDLEWTITKKHSSSKGQLLAKKKVNLMGEPLPRRSIQRTSVPSFFPDFLIGREW